jgi:hypothetical protein
MGKRKNAYRLWARNPEGERLLGRPRSKWVDNIESNLSEII